MSLLQSILHGNRNAKLNAGAFGLAGDSHVGLTRTLNEDCYLYVRDADASAICLGVADGMGGHEGGEVASYLVMSYLLNDWRGRGGAPFSSTDDVFAFLASALQRANAHVFRINQKLKIRWPMGTTATIGVVWGNKLVVAHVGDSRCYCFRKRKGIKLTTDQNWMNEMIKKGGMTAMEAALHPLSNTLTNCVGTQEHLHIDSQVHTILAGDRYLFCTDGVSSLVGADHLCHVACDAADAPDMVKRLLAMSLRNGGTDNITAVGLFTA
jgi:protein phosphatase